VNLFSSELYETIASFGLARGSSILDFASEAGAAVPFEHNGFPVTRVDERTASGTLPFPDERFDVALNAQTIYGFDRAHAIHEIGRVLKRGGILAVWWKQMMAQEALREIRDSVLRELREVGKPEGLQGGFREFYASSVFRDQTLRVLPWRTAIPLSEFVADEAPQVRGPLMRRIGERLGSQNPTLQIAYVQYLYLAKKR